MEFDQNFYDKLNKPDFQPPQWLFRPVWIILYITMGISVFLVSQQSSSPLRPFAISLFIIQLMLNLTWSPIFFIHHKVKSALIICISLTLTVSLMILVFAKISTISAVILIPYLCWLIFASILNAALSKLNPEL